MNAAPRTRATAAPLPWSRGHLVSLVVGGAVTTAMLAASWYQTSATINVDDQVIWANVGVAAVLLFTVVAAVWVHTGRKATTRRRQQILPPLADTAPRETASVGHDHDEAVVLVGPSFRFFHRSDCELVAGKSSLVHLVGQRDGTAARAPEPCGVCQP